MDHPGPTDVPDSRLYHRVEQLLEPGERTLAGVIVHTSLGVDEDLAMTELTIDIGYTIGSVLTDEEIYIYSGNDDPEFGANQHQGLTVTDDAFVWECQQLFRSDSYDLIFYFEPPDDGAALRDRLETEHDVTAVFVPDPTAPEEK